MPKASGQSKSKTNRSTQMRKHWAEMPPRESSARIALLTGLWELDSCRNRLSEAMLANWEEYKRSSLYATLLADLRAARED